MTSSTRKTPALTAVAQSSRGRPRCFDFAALSTRLLGALCELVEAQSGSVMLADDSNSQLRIVAGQGLAAEAFATPIPLESSVSGLIMYVGKPVLLRGRLPKPGRERANVGNSMILPILKDDSAIGVVNLNRDPSHAPFDDEELEAAVKLIADFEPEFTASLQPSFSRNLMLSAVRCLATTIEAKDSYTKGHCDRVRVYARNIAQLIGKDAQFIADLETGATLHDIGKIGVPEGILAKPAPLSEDEYALVKRHPQIGADIVRPLGLPEASFEGVLHHHEKFDGSGYPDGLKNTEIPTAARILALADAFDAMTKQRPYRQAFAVDAALREIERCRGTQFDPVIAHAVLRHPETLTLPPDSATGDNDPSGLDS